MTHFGRLVLAAAAMALGLLVAMGNERGGMPLESRALVIAGLSALILWAWCATSQTPTWVLLIGGRSVGLWLALTLSWTIPVEMAYGSCGSTLARHQPAYDQDGVCDWLVAEEYNRDIPLMFLAVAGSIAAGGGAIFSRQRQRQHGRPTSASGASAD